MDLNRWNQSSLVLAPVESFLSLLAEVAIGWLCCSVVFVLLFLMVLGVVVVGRKIVTLCISLVVTNIIRGGDRVWREQGFIQRWRSNHGNFGDSGSRIISLRLSGGKGDVGAI